VETSEGSKVEEQIYGLEKDALLRLLLLEPTTYKQLTESLAERLGKGISTAKKIVKQWIEEGTIYKSGEFYKRKN
jgi:predicted transcriptional regulator